MTCRTPAGRRAYSGSARTNRFWRLAGWSPLRHSVVAFRTGLALVPPVTVWRERLDAGATLVSRQLHLALLVAVGVAQCHAAFAHAWPSSGLLEPAAPDNLRCPGKSGPSDGFHFEAEWQNDATYQGPVLQVALDHNCNLFVVGGVRHYAFETAQAVLDCAAPGARLVLSCGWHITRDNKDVYSRKLRGACDNWRRIGTPCTRRRPRRPGGGLPAGLRQRYPMDRRPGERSREGESQGMPAWSRHVVDGLLESNITRRVDFARFIVAAIQNHELIHEPPAIVGCRAARRSPLRWRREDARGWNCASAAMAGVTFVSSASPRKVACVACRLRPGILHGRTPPGHREYSCRGG